MISGDCVVVGLKSTRLLNKKRVYCYEVLDENFHSTYAYSYFPCSFGDVYSYTLVHDPFSPFNRIFGELVLWL